MTGGKRSELTTVKRYSVPGAPAGDTPVLGIGEASCAAM